MLIGPRFDQLLLDQLHQGGFCICCSKADGESATLTVVMHRESDTELTDQTAASDWSDWLTDQTGLPDGSDQSSID